MTVHRGWCPGCGRTVAYWPSQIRRLSNSPLGIEATVECTAGHCTEVLLGRAPRLSRAGG